MRIAVLSNSRTAQAAMNSKHAALRVAFNGGAVTGLLVVGLALLAVGLYYKLGEAILRNQEQVVSSLVGLALGASLISVFARLGGGIYTKAADVGADLVGKIETHLQEDDPRNPATIADNVGDNVGDCAGMAADVFETYAVSIIGAILVGFLTIPKSPEAVVFPFLLGGISVIGAIAGIWWVNFRKTNPTQVLVEAVGINALVSAILYWPATKLLFPGTVQAGQLNVHCQSVVSGSTDRTCDDRSHRCHHELLHFDIVQTSSKDCSGLRDRPRNQYHCRVGSRPAGNCAAGALYLSGDHPELHLCRTLRDRDCSHEHAFDGRNHYFTRRFWPYLR